ncbi:MAG TPA: RNA-binding S4 domain-containing protein [Pseudoclavibacter sp.]|nr:RNA-binding S4 domain-containing protein [Pseudoclavibacter sp.]
MPSGVRIDAWLWAVRLYKTRSAATAAVRGGHVRVGGERVKAAYSVTIGDEVRVQREGWERVLVVRALLSKRVGAAIAQTAFEDRTPSRPPRDESAPPILRERGLGRPTKRDRRAIDRLRGRG